MLYTRQSQQARLTKMLVKSNEKLKRRSFHDECSHHEQVRMRRFVSVKLLDERYESLTAQSREKQRVSIYRNDPLRYLWCHSSSWILINCVSRIDWSSESFLARIYAVSSRHVLFQLSHRLKSIKLKLSSLDGCNRLMNCFSLLCGSG